MEYLPYFINSIIPNEMEKVNSKLKFEPYMQSKFCRSQKCRRAHLRGGVGRRLAKEAGVDIFCFFCKAIQFLQKFYPAAIESFFDRRVY